MEQNLSLVEKKSIPMSGDMNNPVCIDPTNTVTIDFSTITSENTTKDISSLKLYKIENEGTWVSHHEILTDQDPISANPLHVTLITKDKKQLIEGEEYQIELKFKDESFVKSYFAVNYTFDLESKGIAALTGRKMVIAISDIHLGQNNDYAEFNKNRPALKTFLTKMKSAPNVKELVIVGDLFDEWFIPATVDTYGGGTQKEFLDKIVNNNKDIITAVDDLSKTQDFVVTYVPGNHDLTITNAEIAGILPKVKQIVETQGLGSYSPIGFPQAIMEHGHRYNMFCAPDPYSNAQIAKGSILPPGYFFTRVAVTSSREKTAPLYPIPHINPTYGSESQYLCYLYAAMWEGILKTFPVTQAFDDKFIVTKINGFNENYALSDIMPYKKPDGTLDMVLYHGIQDNWEKIQTANNVKVHIRTSEAIVQANDVEYTDKMSNIQYFSDTKTDTRIVLFGHTHVPKIRTYSTHDQKKAIYVNSGTWIDNNKTEPTMTFVVLIPRKGPKSMPAFVNLYRYLPNGRIVKLDAQAITGLKL